MENYLEKRLSDEQIGRIEDKIINESEKPFDLNEFLMIKDNKRINEINYWKRRALVAEATHANTIQDDIAHSREVSANLLLLALKCAEEKDNKELCKNCKKNINE